MYKNKAYILIITVIILGLMLLFSIFLVSHYIKEKNIAQIGVNQLIAEQAAISGIEQSLYQVQSAPAWTTGYANSTLTKSNATYNVTFNSASGQPYSTNNYNGASSVTGYNSRIIPAGAIHIVSKGTFSGSSTVEEVIVTVKNGIFRYTLFGGTELSLKNNATTDSYNSAVGPYSVSKQNSGGDLGTNSIVSGAIELKNNSVVNGDIIVGVGGASTVVDADQNAVYGIIEAENVPFPDTPAIPPTGTSLGNINVPNKGNVTINPGIYSNLNIGGKSTLNLNAGSYVFNNISGSQNITINALTKPVVIYFTGSVDLTNNVTINNNGIPKDLIFLGTSTATSFNFKNNAVSFFGLYAPTADIVFENNGELYGSFVGKTMIAENNTDIHFDRNMNVNIPGLPAYVTVDKISRW